LWAEKTKYTAIVGTDANLVCFSRGVGHKNVTSLSWVYNETEIKNNSDRYLVRNHFDFEPDGTPKASTQLSVRNVRYADSGNYGCRIVVNLSGRTTNRDSLTLEVKAEGRKLLNEDCIMF